MSDVVLDGGRSSAEAVTRAKAAAAAPAAIAAVAVVRLALLFRYRIDSDETQHLHVAWGWAHGLLQYRDVFDNHLPLFHVLTAPLLWVGEARPETLIFARLAMLPLFAAMVFLTYRIALSCNPPRAAVWAMLIGSLAPDFFLCSIEFRPDVLWATCWLVSIAILVESPVTPRRAMYAGLALGVAFAVSAKTLLLAVTLAVAAVVTFFVLRHDRIRDAAKCAIAFAASAVVPLAMVASYFMARGAWNDFVYCTVTHNFAPSEHPHRILFAPLFAALIIAGARRLLRDDVDSELQRRRLLLFLTGSIYGAALFSFWPILEREHWLPFYPLAAAGMIPLVLPRAKTTAPRLAFAVVAIEVIWVLRLGTPWHEQVTPSMLLIQETVKLTAPGETVIDLKGETVYRRRAFYYVLEKLTKRAIARGQLCDTIEGDILRTHTMVAVPDNPSFPRQGRSFLLRNFVRTGCLRVAGKIVPARGQFRIEVPGEYAVVSEHHDFRGALDGTPYTGPRLLPAGRHTLAGDWSVRTAVIWQRASALGFSPFVIDPRCSVFDRFSGL